MRVSGKIRRNLYIIVVSILVILLCIGCAGNKSTSNSNEDRLDFSDISAGEPSAKAKTIAKKDKVEKKDAENSEGSNEVPQDSGITVCIDPGHYTNCNVLYFEDGTSYCEGDVTLLVAQKLQQILEEKYGIHGYLTRDSGSISIDGLTDESLDSAYIHLRGEQAAGADLFVSIHTNANQDNANGYPTCEQPVSLNKPILLANMVTTENETALKVGNAIGKNITNVYQQLHLSSGSSFEENMNGSELKEWTDAYNDAVNVAGTICTRTDGYEDYYGVLRGASNVGVPGYIIEHGFHTIPEVRTQIREGNLVTLWAEADARGIAEGFGVTGTEE